MSKILLAGDTHENINAINRIIKKLALKGVEIDAVIQVGDFGFWAEGGEWKGFSKGVFKFRKPTYVIHGNHEDPEVAQPLMGPNPQKHIHNFRLLAPGEIVEVCGLNVMGVGGAKCADNPKVFYPWEPQDFVRAREGWEAQGKPYIDLLITHEAPRDTGMLGSLEISLEYGLNIMDVGEQAVSDLWKAVRPGWQINGHHHVVHEYMTANGLQHLTLPCIEDGYAIFNTDTYEMEVRREKTK